jgi:tryptophanyl-tRNA synthetase
VQSYVPAHAELLWLLEATAYDGELRRMIQYKEKAAKQGTSVRCALLTYPVLMAADILLYGVESVPVGDDQRQHLELARDLAERFNAKYGETFVVPRAVLPAVGARVMDLQQPTMKMSKSASPGSPGVIRLLDPPDVVRRKIARATTDSLATVAYDRERQPGVANLLDITAACQGGTPDEVASELTSYSALKDACAEAVMQVLAPLQKAYVYIAADSASLDGLLTAGAEQARALATPMLDRAQHAIGLR